MKELFNMFRNFFGNKITEDDIISDDNFTKDFMSFTIQARKSDALSGSEFVKTIMNIGANQTRDDLIMKEILDGNIPDFMRNYFEITISNNTDQIKYKVLPDVLCIGNDNDFIRVPMMAKTAKKIADSFNAILPTKLISDQIWKNADCKLSPDPNGPPYTDVQQTTTKFVFHNSKIEKQRNNQEFKLITGHKKDIVIDKALLVNKGKVGIYGWHYKTGAAIQSPVNSSSHHINYTDYSQCIRLISQNAIVNGADMNIYDVLNDSKLSYLISHQGSYDAKKIYL